MDAAQPTSQKVATQVQQNVHETDVKKTSMLSKLAIAVSVVAIAILGAYVAAWAIKGWQPDQTNAFLYEKGFVVLNHIKDWGSKTYNVAHTYFQSKYTLPVVPVVVK